MMLLPWVKRSVVFLQICILPKVVMDRTGEDQNDVSDRTSPNAEISDDERHDVSFCRAEVESVVLLDVNFLAILKLNLSDLSWLLHCDGDRGVDLCPVGNAVGSRCEGDEDDEHHQAPDNCHDRRPPNPINWDPEDCSQDS